MYQYQSFYWLLYIHSHFFFQLENFLLIGEKENWSLVKDSENKCDYNRTHISIFGFEPFSKIKYENNNEKYYCLKVTSSRNNLLTMNINRKIYCKV